MRGVANAEDAVEYMLAGTTATQVGTATFEKPKVMLEIVDGMKAFCARKGIACMSDLAGAVKDTGTHIEWLEVTP